LKIFKFRKKISEISLILPSEKELRSFGIIFGILTISIFAFLFPYIFEYRTPGWPFVIAIFMILASVFFPKKLEVVYQIWILIGNILAYINTRIILGFIFLALFLPTGLIVRVLGKDLLRRRLVEKQESYRIKSTVRDIKHFDKPY